MQDLFLNQGHLVGSLRLSTWRMDRFRLAGVGRGPEREGRRRSDDQSRAVQPHIRTPRGRLRTHAGWSLGCDNRLGSLDPVQVSLETFRAIVEAYRRVGAHR
jgi:hypothetical protein